MLLEEAGYHPCSLTTEEGNSPWLLLQAEQTLTLKKLQTTCPFVSGLEAYSPTQEISWDEQWATHAPGWKEGLLWLTVGEVELKLIPGPGFGDLSHPTTQLCLHLLQEQPLKGQTVLDIGCGSGILSLAAAALGARAYGIDIDDAALRHAHENAVHNELEVCLSKPEELHITECVAPLVVMNMIRSEQHIAKDSIPTAAVQLITSGVLEEEKEAYIQEQKEQGWQLHEERTLEGWCAFIWHRN